MNKEQRQRDIVERMRLIKQRIRFSELAAIYNVENRTIRRDFEYFINEKNAPSLCVHS